jgi:hypothetical protein
LEETARHLGLRFFTRRAGGMRTPNSDRSWRLSFDGRPVEFIGEVMGPEWWTEDWAAWRVFVKTLFGLPLGSRAELEIFRQCTGLREYRPRRHNEAWVPVGRRGGKSRVMSLVAVYLAACRDYTPYLAPGEVGFVAVLSDTREHAAIIMNYMKGALQHSRLSSLVAKPLVESIALRNRVTIEVVTASIAAVRARTVLASLLDEIAFWQPDESMANPDVEIVRGLRPSMITIPDAVQVAASSRYARKGALYSAYRDFFGKPEGPLVWSADTVTMHPGIDRVFLAAEYERDPVAAAAEYGLEWRSDVASFIEDEVVEAVTPRGLLEIPPLHNISYSAFCDPSGGAQDSMTLAIGHREGKKGILDRILERRPPFEPDEVVQSFAEEMARYNVYRVRGDRYGGVWPAERFAAHGVKYEPSEMPKSDIYREFLPLMTARCAQLLDIPRLRMQLLGLERRVARSGRDSVDHAPGGHDDLINAAAGVLVMVGTDKLAAYARLAGM